MSVFSPPLTGPSPRTRGSLRPRRGQAFRPGVLESFGGAPLTPRARDVFTRLGQVQRPQTTTGPFGTFNLSGERPESIAGRLRGTPFAAAANREAAGLAVPEAYDLDTTFFQDFPDPTRLGLIEDFGEDAFGISPGKIDTIRTLQAQNDRLDPSDPQDAALIDANNLTIATIKEEITAGIERETIRDEALAEVGGIKQELLAIINSPENQDILERLQQQSSQQFEEIDEQEIDRMFSEGDRLIGQYLGAQYTQAGQDLAASGFGEGGFARQLAQQASRNALTARTGLRTDLDIYRNRINTDARKFYFDRLTAFQGDITRASAAVVAATGDTVIKLLTSPTFVPQDFTPIANFLLGAQERNAAAEELFDAENPDIWTMFVEGIVGGFQQFVSISGAQVFQSLLP